MAVKKSVAGPKVVNRPPINVYGFEELSKTDQLTIELMMFVRRYGSSMGRDGKLNPLGLPRWKHFKNICDMLWNYPNSRHKVIWHPWMERMVRNACKHTRLSIAGCASSGKTQFAGIWAIVNYLAAPTKTKVIVTSTSLKDSRNRIWGVIEEYWQALPAHGWGELVSSQGFIRFVNPFTQEKTDRSGITLIAGDKSSGQDAIGRLIGFKADRIIIIADELPELSEKIITAVVSNLEANPYCQVIGIGNPNSMYDPHGQFSEPQEGWQSVTEFQDEWQGKRAYVIRFDAEQSPNLGPQGTIYPFLPTRDRMEDKKKELGERSLQYYRMWRGFWCPTGASDTIISGEEIEQYNASVSAVWAGGWVKVAALDPAFTNGGDRSVLRIGRVGLSNKNVKTLEFQQSIMLNEDVTNKKVPRSEQIAMLLRKHCEENGVLPENLAIDATGGGAPFCDMVASKWSDKFLRVHFGGAASELPVSLSDSTKANERYGNRVSEIWYSMREHIRANQIRGIDPAIAKELTSRLYATGNRGVITIESKTIMRKRTGFSPDEADAACILVDLCKQRHNFLSADKPIRMATNKPNLALRKFQNVYNDGFSAA